MKRALVFLLLCLGAALARADTPPVRLKDLGKFAGWRENALVGYGLVTGLAGTGDSSANRGTRQSLANMLSQFGVALTPDAILSRNAAAVMITASLPPFAAEGDTLDVTVTSLGDARSLAGGSLLMAALKGPDGKVYALAQGAVSVGGYKYDMNGNVQQKNHPTVGTVPAGATVENGVTARMVDASNQLVFRLAEADYTTATRAAAAINAAFGRPLARARDAEAVAIAVPDGGAERLPELIARIEAVAVKPDRRARVVINERTGTVVAGGDVALDRVVISHGDLKISIVTENSVSQPFLVRDTGAGVRTETVSNSRIEVQEKNETGYVAVQHNTVAELVAALTRIRINTRDIISILQSVKAQGALRAELIIQ
jgi:flagellar P-ring protein precursor FlgI